MSAPSRSRNAELLAAYGRCRSTANRNAVVRANLPLVWQLARQESQRSGHPFDDLVQVGCLGLIRAVERYELEQGTTLSTAACRGDSAQLRGVGKILPGLARSSGSKARRTNCMVARSSALNIQSR